MVGVLPVLAAAVLLLAGAALAGGAAAAALPCETTVQAPNPAVVLTD